MHHGPPDCQQLICKLDNEADIVHGQVNVIYEDDKQKRTQASTLYNRKQHLPARSI